MKKGIEPPYKHLTPFKRCVLQNFPFIEADFDALTNYGLLCKIVEYLNKVIASQNEVQTNVEILNNSFIELKNYVDNYFDNLDVQEEINNKLDEMADDGTLQEIVAAYLNASAVWGFDTVADMKSATNLIEGSYARTLGYYTINDGGGALYKIRKVTNDDTVDEAFLLEIGDPADELVAELVYNNEVNILQLGAKKYDGTKHDIKSFIEKYLARLTDIKRFTLKIPYGLYHCDSLVITQAFDIIGDEGFSLHTPKQTTITSMYDNQEFIFSLGSQVALCRNFVLKNICFTSAEFTYADGNYTLDTYKNIDNAVIMRHACFGITDNLFFDSINGTALKITTSFEIYFKLLNFRNIDARNNAILVFGTKIDGLISSPNISACNFEKIMFEQTLGNLVKFEQSCRFLNNHFENINFEDHSITRPDITQTNFTSDNIATYEASDPVHWAIFAFDYAGELACSNIGSLDINNLSYRYTTINGQNYAYDRIINIPDNYGYINTCINNINITGQNKNVDLIYSHLDVYYPTSLKLGRVVTNSNYDLIMNVDNFTNIEADTRIKGLYNELLPFLPDSITPAYNVAPNRSGSPARVLRYDSDATNKLKVCSVVNKSKVGCVFTLAKPTIHIRAKIENGATPTIAISGTRYATTQLTGTGAFKVYELTMHEASAIGDTVQLGQPVASSGEDILIDWIA